MFFACLFLSLRNDKPVFIIFSVQRHRRLLFFVCGYELCHKIQYRHNFTAAHDPRPYFCYTFCMRVVTLTKDGVILLTPLDMQEFHLVPGDEFILANEGDIITLTPLNLLPAQD